MDLQLYLFASLGVLISIVLSILRALLPQPPKQGLVEAKTTKDIIKPYLITGLFSLISGILIYAGFVEEIEPKAAILAGYAWDSTLQKIRGAG